MEVPVSAARGQFSDLVNRVPYGGERVVLTRHGRPVAGLVPLADLERLQAAELQGPVGFTGSLARTHPGQGDAGEGRIAAAAYAGPQTTAGAGDPPISSEPGGRS